MHLAQFTPNYPRTHRAAKFRLTVLFLLSTFLLAMFSAVQANAETRTLRMYYGHSKESATITFKRNGRYIKRGLRKANRFLRDWRRKEPTRMDPKLLDLVWEVYKKSGSRKPIQVISGYRSPRTNRMLRRRGRKVARHSQHTRGKALDFFLPDVSVKRLRALGLRAHGGGVGYYRGSFVHLDTGKVRHWPRMSRRQLARVFPRGKTIHVPRGGRRLRGYKIAKANLRRGLNANGTRNRYRRSKPIIKETKIAKVVKKKKKTPKPKKAKGPDPFSQDSSAVAKAQKAKRIAEEKKKKEAEKQQAAAEKKKLEEQRKRDEAEKAEAILLAKAEAKKAEAILLAKAEAEKLEAEKLAKRAAAAVQTAALKPAKIPTPNLRPSVEPTTKLALAPTEPKIRPNVMEPVSATEMVLGTPSVVQLTPAAETLRPSVSDTKPAELRTNDVAKLASRAKTSLTRKREVVLPKTVKKVSKKAKKAEVQLAALTPKEEKPSPATLSASHGQKAALKKKQQIIVAKLADLPTPKWRGKAEPKSSVSTKKKVSTPIPLPSVKKSAAQQKVVAVNSTTPMRSELKLGDLDSRSVKKWAVASSTRTGSVASLKAPIYKQGTKRVAPSSVYSGGFAFNRSPLRSDRFSGKALTRVAFAHFGDKK